MNRKSYFELRGLPLMSTTTLAFWRLKRTWGMLCFTGLGILAAVVLVCAIPLYSRVATTAGLRGVLTSTPDEATVTLGIATGDLNPLSISQGSAIATVDAQPVVPYLDGPPQFFISLNDLQGVSPSLPNGSDTFSLLAAPIQNVPAHAKLLRGHFPHTINLQNGRIEIAITQATASSWGLSLGSVVQADMTGFIAGQVDRMVTARLPLQVVGIYSANVASDVFWHGYSLDPVISQKSIEPVVGYSALLSTDELLKVVAAIGDNQDFSKVVGTHGVNGGDFILNQSCELNWYYQLNTTRLDIVQLDNLITQIGYWQNNVLGVQADSFNGLNAISLTGAVLSDHDQPSDLQLYRTRLEVIRIPVLLLLLQITALILFFITLMAELLIERQVDTIAILGSRGANKRQIFGAFFTQGLGMSVLALLIGPVLAILGVYLASQRLLTTRQQGALNILTHNPLVIVYSVRGYALFAFVVSIAAMAFATSRAVGFNVLDRRRESARTTGRPLWQRLNLDLVAAVVALVGYVLSLYLASLTGLDETTEAVIVSPLVLLAPLFLLLAGVFLLLRLFPLLLQFGANLAIRGRGAAAMLALGQMSRAPRRSLRLVLLLTLTTAFAIFTLVFSASQVQHIDDLANYQVGADFSGQISTLDTSLTISQETTIVRRTPGVLSATLGYTTTVATGANLPSDVQFLAVDAGTFGQTALWTAQNSSQPLDTLMRQLVAQRNNAAHGGAIPVVVDSLLWNTLNLKQGEHFTLLIYSPDGTSTAPLPCIALDEVQRIPTGGSTGSVLLDYQSFSSAYQRIFQDTPIPNYLWVKSKDDAISLNNVRNSLTTSQPYISPLYDRRELVSQLNQDPLTLNLLGVLALSAVTALMLALVGNLLASWLNARNRQTSFVVLRALGTSSQQVASILVWEQGITYISAILLGILFGALLAITAIPVLVFSTAPPNGAVGESISFNSFYALQQLLPVRLAIPPSLVIGLLLLIGICLLALGIMIRTVTRPELGKVLRLNED